MLKEEKVLGVKINIGFDYKKTLDYIEDTLLKDGKCHYICTTNPEFIMDAQVNPLFREVINNSDLSVPDGSGVLFALEYNKRILEYLRTHGRNSFFFPLIALFTGISVGLRGLVFGGSSYGDRVIGVSLTEKICELASIKGYSVFFLGGRPRDIFGNGKSESYDLATLAADVIRKKYPSIRIIGSTSAYSSNEVDDAKTVSYIHKCMKESNIDRLDILLVAYYHMYQENWILRNAKSIPTSTSVGIGGTLDVFASFAPSIPTFIIQRNLEWLFRFIAQPWRLKRILKAFPRFPLKVFLKSLSVK